MSSTLIIVLIVVAVVVAAIVISRRSRPTLPEDRSQPSAPQLKEPTAEAPPAAEEERAPSEAPSAAEVDSEPAAVTPEPEPPPSEQPAPPEPALQPAQPAPVRRQAAEPTPEEVAALKKGLASTRGGFIARLAKVFSGKKEIDPALLDEVEEVLITADIGVKTATKILDRLRERMNRKELQDADKIWDAIRNEAAEILGNEAGGILLANNPTVIVVVGVNGVGKTTTIGKLASRFQDEGKKVMLAAGDTFRAAAVLQLEVWGRRVGCPVVKGKDNADPGAVIFDAIQKAKEEDVDVVIADTAGRLHTKVPLMEELKKVGRTAEKALGRPADEVLLVLDSTNGQNAIQQAQMFSEALPVSGIALTKLDGTAKGGVILGIVDQHKLPVRYIGIGERVEDLREFEPRTFVHAMFEKPPEGTAAA